MTSPFIQRLLDAPNDATARRLLATLGIGTTTDAVAEGVSNLYFTDARARATIDAALVAGTNITLTVDPLTHAVTIAAAGGGSPWTLVKKTGGTSRASTVTLADDPDLQIVIPAAGTYVIRGALWFNLGSQTAGVQYGFAYTGSSTQLGYRSNYSTIGSSAGSDNDFSFAAAAFPSGNGAGNSAANLRMWVEIVLIATSAGTLSLQWAQSASNALATTLSRGSYLEWATF